MELRHLRYFCAVAEALNFTQAATRLRVAQPALSRQIMALEEELGAQLFDRNRQRVLLTDAGRLFYSHAQKILAQVDIATLAVRDVASGAEGELRIAQDWRLPATLVSRAIAAYRAQFPRVEVIVRELPMGEQLAAIHSHRIHLGFVVSALIGHDTNLNATSISTTRIVALVSATHRLAGRKSVKLAEMRREEWICIETPEGGYRTFLIQTCRNAGFAPRFSRAIATQSGGIVGLVIAGMGVGLIPESALPPQTDGLSVLSTDCDQLDMRAVWTKQDHSPLLQKFLEILQKLVASRSS